MTHDTRLRIKKNKSKIKFQLALICCISASICGISNSQLRPYFLECSGNKERKLYEATFFLAQGKKEKVQHIYIFLFMFFVTNTRNKTEAFNPDCHGLAKSQDIAVFIST